MLDQTYSSSFQVQQVVDEKLIDGETHFLVKWVGYDHSQNTWEPLRHMTHSKDKIKEWQQFKIAQLNLASHKKLHEQVNMALDKSKAPKRNSQTFKNVSNPYKKVYLRIDDLDQYKAKESKEDRTKIQTIFDQPEMKKLIKINKSQRKKKQLQMFEKRLKTRPKIWQKYLQNEDQVIKRANEKIKQVIDKAYGGNLKTNNQSDQKQINLPTNLNSTKKNAQKTQQKRTNEKRKLKRTNTLMKQLSRQQIPPSTKEINKIIFNQQKTSLNQLPVQQLNIGLPVKQTHKRKVKNIFSSTQEDQDQINQNKPQSKMNQNHQIIKPETYINKNQKSKKNLMMLEDSSFEQETNFISLKERQPYYKKYSHDQKQTLKQLKSQIICPQNKNTKTIDSKSGSLQRKIWVKDLIKGMVQQNKKKKSIEKSVGEEQKRKIFTITPQTVLLSQSMIKKIKGNKLSQKHSIKGQGVQMSKISEQSSRYSYFSKKSSISNIVHEGMFRSNKLNCEELNLQVVKVNANELESKVQINQKQINLINLAENIKVQEVKQTEQKNAICEQIKSQAALIQNSNQSDTIKQVSVKFSQPFECSISSVDQRLKQNSYNSSIIEQVLLNLISKPQTNDNSQGLQFGQSFPSQSSESVQQSYSSKQSQSIINQEQSQRIINYSTLTNHISTDIPEQSSQSQNINRNNGIEFMNLIRQQSMSTRASQKTQLPFQNIHFNSQSQPIQSITNSFNSISNQFQNQLQDISHIQLQIIKESQSKHIVSQSQRIQQSNINKNIPTSKRYQNSSDQILRQNYSREKSTSKIKSQRFQENQLEKNKQKYEKQSQIQQEVLDCFFQWLNPHKFNIPQNNKYPQNQLQKFEININNNQEQQQMMRSFVKQNLNESVKMSSNSMSNRDKESLILNYDFSSIN